MDIGIDKGCSLRSSEDACIGICAESAGRGSAVGVGRGMGVGAGADDAGGVSFLILKSTPSSAARTLARFSANTYEVRKEGRKEGRRIQSSEINGTVISLCAYTLYTGVYVYVCMCIY
jgi:hypothetical protein